VENFPQYVPCCLIVALSVAGLDSTKTSRDDAPPPKKHLIIEMEAGIEGVAEVNPYVLHYDGLDGLAESLRGF